MKRAACLETARPPRSKLHDAGNERSKRRRGSEASARSDRGRGAVAETLMPREPNRCHHRWLCRRSPERGQMPGHQGISQRRAPASRPVQPRYPCPTRSFLRTAQRVEHPPPLPTSRPEVHFPNKEKPPPWRRERGRRPGRSPLAVPRLPPRERRAGVRLHQPRVALPLARPRAAVALPRSLRAGRRCPGTNTRSANSSSLGALQHDWLATNPSRHFAKRCRHARACPGCEGARDRGSR